MLSWLKLITYPPDGQQARRFGWIGFNFFAQTPHMDSHRAGINILCATPDTFKQLLACKDLVWMLRQQIKHIELLDGQLNARLIYHDRATARVNTQAFKGQRAFRPCLALLLSDTAEHSSDAANQFLRAERLDDVIVCTHFKPGNT